MVDGLDRILPALLPLLAMFLIGTAVATAADAFRLAPGLAASPSGRAVEPLMWGERAAAGLSRDSALGRASRDAGERLRAESLGRNDARRSSFRRGLSAFGPDPNSNEGSASLFSMVTGGAGLRELSAGRFRPAERFRRRISLRFPLRA